MNRLAILATIAVFSATACQKQQDQTQAQDSTARNLTLAPAESSATMRDVPDRKAAPAAHPTTPRTRTPATRNPATKTPPPPAAPAQLTAGVGTKLDMEATDTISSRTAKVGDAFTARVMGDVKDAAGQVVIPAGSMVHGTVTAVKPAPNPRTPGTLTLSVSSITVRGASYPIEAAIDSVQTTTKGRGVTTGDAAKVGAGAVAGAVLGRVLGGNKKGTIIGGIAGGLAGAGYANATKDSDILLPAGAHIVVRLTKELAVSAH